MIEVLSNFFELTEEQKQEYDFVKNYRVSMFLMMHRTAA